MATLGRLHSSTFIPQIHVQIHIHIHIRLQRPVACFRLEIQRTRTEQNIINAGLWHPFSTWKQKADDTVPRSFGTPHTSVI